MDNKTDFRLYAKEARKSLDIAEISKKIVRKIRSLDVYKSANNVMLFYPMTYEIDLRTLLKDDKNFYLPKVSGRNILACPYTENLVKSAFGIMEPETATVNPNRRDWIILPCRMADKNAYRIGYGGGYYDRFLADLDVRTVAVVSKTLYVDNLPHEDYDIKADKVIAM